MLLLSIINRLAIASMRLTATVVVLLLDTVTHFLRRQTRNPAVTQDVAQPSAAPVPVPVPVIPPPVPVVMPDVHVHIHHPAPATTTKTAAASPFDHPDHGIYITTGSHLLMPHPAASALLERLDDILYQAAFRRGEPFILTPFAETSLTAQTADSRIPPEDGDDAVFFSREGRALPPADGALWIRRSGHLPKPVATN